MLLRCSRVVTRSLPPPSGLLGTERLATSVWWRSMHVLGIISVVFVAAGG
jgi:hypothetical protein